ncbi:MAG: indolepyruvate ferredoxin oxidoreductase subunit alpha [Candidatus Abyssobacteria bacterium SURF_17]|uniref:Indolepyruvate oxidoreductase subunit IorA n=1 Tax=Candidatus Abyssobacteria bacterium SURF_17 TaxID=2093361 RepID=A0A419EZF4_9BACT|nr:MAG: indolepyruvate ferredoxin oxidoreductase subunit alpha [Candidatus Abyssubacteria bacterium SURF_17]
MEALLGNEGEVILAMGNEAIARGGIEAAVGYFSMYPGTPATEIGQTFESLSRHLPDFYMEYSANEHVSLNGAMGASWAGIRSMVAMKHVGMNVAAEPAHFLGYTGVDAGLVIVIGSDPGATSSTGEQDDRWYSLHTHLPLLEPSTIQEAKDFTAIAFELSEKYSIPFVINAPSRLCHNIGDLRLGRIAPHKGRHAFRPNYQRYFNLFGQAVRNHQACIERVSALGRSSDAGALNKIIPGNASWGIVTSSVNYLYVMEALEILELFDVPVLKVGMSHPFPAAQLQEFAKSLEKIVVIEDLEGFLEYQLKRSAFELKLNCEVVGKEVIPPSGETSPDMVLKALSSVSGREIPGHITEAARLGEQIAANIPQRIATFCIGCPHRASVYAVLKASEGEAIIGGDIGCYTMASLPPFKAAEWCTCMNCGLSAAQGMSHVGDARPIVALVGDSTFFHSGIQSVQNAVANNANVLLIILDNRWIAMTGHQRSPTTSVDVKGSRLEAVDLKALLKTLGVARVRTVDVFDVPRLRSIIADELKNSGMRVIIAKGECALQVHRRERYIVPRFDEFFSIVRERCQRCGACYKDFGCPAIMEAVDDDGEYYYIDEELCIRCGACRTVCPNSAIVMSRIRPRKAEMQAKAPAEDG